MSKFITKRLKAHMQEFVALVSIAIIATTTFMIISTTTTTTTTTMMLYYSSSHAPAHMSLHMDKDEHCICGEQNTTETLLLPVLYTSAGCMQFTWLSY